MKEYKGLVVFIIIACILTMTIGFAALSQRLNVSGTSNIVSNFKVKITDIKSTATGKASDKTPPTFDDATATFSTNLVSPGDAMTYDITVSNTGNVNAKLEKINMSTSNNPAIEFSYSGITEGEILNAGSTTTLQVVVKYSDSVTSQPGTLSSDLTITLDYEQSINGSDNVEVASSCFTYNEYDNYVEITAYDYAECGLDVITIPETINGKPITDVLSGTFPRSMRQNSATIYNNANILTDWEAVLYGKIASTFNTGGTFASMYDTNVVVIAKDENSYAATPASCFTYTENNNEVTINSYDVRCGGTRLIIPNNINGKTVTTIGNNAVNNAGINSLYIPNTITTIGDYAIANNSLTNSVFIADSVKNVGDYAFYNNELTSWAVIGNGMETIGNYAFANNELEHFDFGNSLKTIGDYAFADALIATPELIIPSSTISIGTHAFRGFGRESGYYDNIITNLTGKPFDWNLILGNETAEAFIAGTVIDSTGTEIIIKSE